MVGIVIITHGQLGDALIHAAEFIIGSALKAMISISVDLNQDPEIIRKKIADCIKTVDQNNGVLILTDMFGGTPSNLGYSFLEEGKVEVLSGVNLPILVKAVDLRGKNDLAQIAKDLEAFGKRSITLASGILKGNKRG